MGVWPEISDSYRRASRATLGAWTPGRRSGAAPARGRLLGAAARAGGHEPRDQALASRGTAPSAPSRGLRARASRPLGTGARPRGGDRVRGQSAAEPPVGRLPLGTGESEPRHRGHGASLSRAARGRGRSRARDRSSTRTVSSSTPSRSPAPHGRSWTLPMCSPSAGWPMRSTRPRSSGSSIVRQIENALVRLPAAGAATGCAGSSPAYGGGRP